MKSVLTSIQPYYVFLIIARKMGWDIPQEKTVEIRKDCPKARDWNKITHIYCSKNRKSFNRIPKEYQPLMKRFLGKVIGEFICDRINKILPVDVFWEEIGYDLDDKQLVETCLTRKEIKNYGKRKPLYGLHITDLQIYDTPKELSEIFVKGECEGRLCMCCKNAHRGMGWLDGNTCDEDDCEVWGIRPLTRPPQSWCYVESL